MAKSKVLGGGIRHIRAESPKGKGCETLERWSRFFHFDHDAEKRILSNTTVSEGLRPPTLREISMSLEEASAVLCLRLRNEKDRISLAKTMAADPNYAPDRNPWGPEKIASTEETLAAIRTILVKGAVKQNSETLSQLAVLSIDSPIREAAADALSKS